MGIRGWDYDGIYSNLLTLWCDMFEGLSKDFFHKFKVCISYSNNNNMIMIHLSRWDQHLQNKG